MLSVIRRWLSPQEDTDLVSILIEGHARIRDFVDLAVEVGDHRAALGTPELAEDAQRVERYFARTFPLHVADEETSLLPRLRGRSSRLDAALYRMQEQHRIHEHMLGRLCTHASALAADPSNQTARDALGAVARPLRSLMDDHLDGEAKVVFPAVREHFSPAEERTVRREMLARRR